MKTISDFFSDSLIQSFGWTLIHSIWQAFALMLVASATFFFMRRSNAKLRYGVAVSFLTVQLLASVATFIYYISKTAPAVSISKTLSASGLSDASYSPTLYSISPTVKVQLWLHAHVRELVVCWLIGAGILLLKFIGSWIFTERLRMSARNVMDKEWRARFGIMVAKMQISRSIGFKETAKVKTPMVLGTFSPVILIPIGLLSGFSVAQVEAILAHELAHIKRHDYLVNLLQSIVEVVFFFHPAIWWLSDRIRIEREHCCDDIALEVCGDKMSLAHALVKVAEWQAGPALAMAFASKKPLLLNRVKRVLGVSAPKSERSFSYLSVTMLAVSLIVGISVYATAQKNDKQKVKKAAKAKTINRPARISEIDDFEPNEVPELEGLRLAEFGVPVDVDLHIDTDFGIPDMNIFGTGNDTLDRKINEIQKRIDGLQRETEPLQQRLEEIHLEMEKHQFQVERIQREREKIEWKKNEAMERRSELMEQSREIFETRNENKNGQNKNTDHADVDKQVADYEQQIKVQEDIVSQLNGQLNALRKEIAKAEEPIRAMDPEIQDINSKMEDIHAKIGLETLSIEKIEVSARPHVAQAPRKTAARKTSRIAPPPPPPPAAANPPKPAKAPLPPVPPAKK